MPRQVILDRLELKGLSIFRETGQLRVEAHYSLMAGSEVFRTETRDVTASLPPTVIADLERAWGNTVSQIKTSESI